MEQQRDRQKNQLDLNEIANRQDLTLTIASREDPSERDARLRREDAKAALERTKELALYIATFSVIGAVFCICAYITLVSTYSSEMERWATALLASIVTGVVTYAFGKSSK